MSLVSTVPVSPWSWNDQPLIALIPVTSSADQCICIDVHNAGISGTAIEPRQSEPSLLGVLSCSRLNTK